MSGREFGFAGFAVDAGLPVVAGFDVKAGEPTATPDVGIDVDGVAEVEREVGRFLRGVPADHDFS